MTSRVVSGGIATLVLALGVGGCSSDSGDTETSPPAPPESASRTSTQPTPPDAPTTVKLEENILDLGGGVTMKTVLIPAGEFMMGSHESAEALAKEFGLKAKYYENEHPQHRVKITKPFYLGVYEVTQQQYEKVMGDKPWSDESNVKESTEHAATQVTWENAQEFCQKLSSTEGRTFRLPTEAEWEYACRAGSTTDRIGDLVGLKRPNDWGLHDMCGDDVWEWCQDWYGKDYYENSPTDDPTGPASGVARAVRVMTGAAVCRPVTASRPCSGPSLSASAWS